MHSKLASSISVPGEALPAFKPKVEALGNVPRQLRDYAFSSHVQLHPLINHVKVTYDLLMQSPMMSVKDVRAAYKTDEGKELSEAHSQLSICVDEYDALMGILGELKDQNSTPFLRYPHPDSQVFLDAKMPLASMTLIQCCFVKLSAAAAAAGRAPPLRSEKVIQTKTYLRTAGMLQFIKAPLLEEVDEMVNGFQEKERTLANS